MSWTKAVEDADGAGNSGTITEKAEVVVLANPDGRLVDFEALRISIDGLALAVSQLLDRFNLMGG